MINIPQQRWQIAPERSDLVTQISQSTGLLPIVSQVIVNRGIDTPELAHLYVEPESQNLPSPLEEFKDLAISVELLCNAITSGEKIAICGDYDADGMTSTALLLRALKHLGADVDYAIPSRMKDGYGINNRIVEEFAATDIGLILTVDNGISAYEPILHAVELGLTVIITDHHDLPEKLPPADAILNPKLLSETSPYRGLAGVGVAYILAVATAQSLGKLKGLTHQILELFTLGTIADLAPLIGVNRRWLKRGLRQLPNSQLEGIQALMQVAGVSEEQKQLKPDDIGFRLGPRINAVGRLADPQIVIELLTTDDPGIALERAYQCEQINRKRQELCEQIEQEAIWLIESTPILWQEERMLAIVKEDWHHGVIGIVASRLVERYGVPVFIATYEENDLNKIRGSARGIEEFNIFEALNYCHDLLGKYGGHKAAGGFSLAANNWSSFQKKISEFSHQCLKIEHLKPLIKIDLKVDLEQINLSLYQQIDTLQPWGIGNDIPIFWTKNVLLKEQRLLKGNHLKLILKQDNSIEEIKAIAWRWKDYFPLPNRLDIAYKLQANNWQGNTSVELEIVGVRLPTTNLQTTSQVNEQIKKASFNYQGRIYACSWRLSLNELRIRNEQGKVLAVILGDHTGLIGNSREDAKQIDLTQPYFQELIQLAQLAIAKNN